METSAADARLSGEEENLQKFYESLAGTVGYFSTFPVLVKQWRSKARGPELHIGVNQAQQATISADGLDIIVNRIAAKTETSEEKIGVAQHFDPFQCITQREWLARTLAG